MKMICNVPDEAIKCVKDGTWCGSYMVEKMIATGIPLPKGHGRLIDADVLKTAFPCGESVRTECVRSTIEYAPTIIEADTESEMQDADSD